MGGREKKLRMRKEKVKKQEQGEGRVEGKGGEGRGRGGGGGDPGFRKESRTKNSQVDKWRSEARGGENTCNS